MTGQQGAHVLDVEIALDDGFNQVAEGGGEHRGGAGEQALPGMAVQQQRHADRAGDQAGHDRARQALPGLLRADDGGHRMMAAAAEGDAGEVAADIAADGQDDEREDPARAVVFGQHRGHEGCQERQVGHGEDARGHVLHVAGAAAGQPPDEDDDHGERERGQGGLWPQPVLARQHRRAARRYGDHRDLDVALGEGSGQLGQGDHQGGPHVQQERCLDGQQREHRQAAEYRADADRGREVAAGSVPAGRCFRAVMGRLPVPPYGAGPCRRNFLGLARGVLG